MLIYFSDEVLKVQSNRSLPLAKIFLINELSNFDCIRLCVEL